LSKSVKQPVKKPLVKKSDQLSKSITLPVKKQQGVNRQRSVKQQLQIKSWQQVKHPIKQPQRGPERKKRNIAKDEEAKLSAKNRQKQQIAKKEQQLNKRLLLLKEDLGLLKEKLSIDDEGLLAKFNHLKGMTLKKKSGLERKVISKISSVSENNLDELIQITRPPKERLQCLGVKATTYIGEANRVGIEERVCKLREEIEVATKGKNLEEGYNRLNISFEALKKEVEGRQVGLSSFFNLEDEIDGWIEEVGEDNNLSVEKGQLKNLKEKVVKAKEVIFAGGSLPKLKSFKDEFNKIKAEQSLERVKKKIELLDELDGLLGGLVEINWSLSQDKEREKSDLQQEINETWESVKNTNAKEIDSDEEKFRSKLEKLKGRVEKFKKKGRS
jgi:hypothetical protein